MEAGTERPRDEAPAPNPSIKLAPKPDPDTPFIIAIGASAGGLEALRDLLSRLDTLVGASFIVVQHMAPTYRSMLAELLARDTIISVRDAADGDVPLPNVLYVTPPNHDIVFSRGRLKLLDLNDRAGPKPSIDRCFASLAEELGENCGGIILSGTGSDGSQGARAIRAAGGFVIAQEPGSAKYDSMPRAAIGTGSVDLVLSPPEIAAQLADIMQHLRDDQVLTEIDAHETAEPFATILELLKHHSKVDFDLYKPNTLQRRIQRRMTANRLKDIAQYVEFLQDNPGEVKRLFQDVLISATSFFRDKEKYEALRQGLRRNLPARGVATPVRAWSAGCASGEEAYSLVIVLQELLEELGLDSDVQVFATDIDEQAMTAARRGIYSEASVESVPPKLLARYFEKLDGAYQIRKSVRERVVFSRHDLTRDPPFMRMDLIACRNVFIYFGTALQERVLKLFHYALSPTGLLFLGKAESIGSTKSFFTPIDSKLYQRNDRPSDPSISFSGLQLERSERRAADRWHQRRASNDTIIALVRAFAPNSLVLDEDLAVREIYGNARNYLSFPEGSVTHAVEKLLPPDIKNKIITLLHRAKRSGEPADGMHFEIESAAGRELVQPRVHPVRLDNAPRLVLSFNAVPAAPEAAQHATGAAPLKEMEELERELAATREHLQTVIQEQETANEELQALNEEMHSANEELQSTNEELETANEELQSSNEELTTLNEELHVKSSELLDMNNYLRAIQDAIEYPVLLVDKNLNLSDFNGGAEQTFRIEARHKGKNVRLIPAKESLHEALDAIERCLRDGTSEVVHVTSAQFDLKVTCKAIIDHRGRVDGVVASFMDYTEIARSLRRAESSERKLTAIFENVPTMLSVKDAAGRYTYVNQHFVQAIGKNKAAVLGKTDRELFDPHTAESFRKRDFEVLNSLQAHRAEERIDTASGPRVQLATRFPLFEDGTAAEAVCNISVDVTERVEAHRTLKLFQEVISSSNQSILIFDRVKGRQGYRANFISNAFTKMFGGNARELVGDSLRTVLGSAFGEQHAERLLNRVVKSDGEAIEIQNGGPEGQCFEVRATHYPRGRRPGRHLCLVIVDSTQRRNQETLLRSKQEEVLKTARLASLGEMAAGIAHELNTPLSTVQNYVDLMRRTRVNGRLNDTYAEQAIDAIEDTVGRISEIIVGLRSFAKTEACMDMRDTDLVTLIRDVVTMCEFHLRNKGVRLDFDPEQPAVPVMCQPTQLSQVLVNLINNAIDAVRSLEEKWIRIEIARHDGSVQVRVIDSGEGISDKIAAMVMTPFFTTKEEGTGLGLSLARSIMKAHEGDLVVDTHHNNTCFELTLPQPGS